MEKKNKKPIFIIICAVVVLAVAGVAIWLIAKNNNNNNSDSKESSSQTENATTKVTSSELATGQVSDEIGYGDFSAMQTLSKAIQNGQKTGAIVSIDGIVSHKVSSYSIGENNPEKSGATYVGTVFNIEDASESDYPKDGERVTIVAKVVEVSPMNFQLVTLKSYVKNR